MKFRRIIWIVLMLVCFILFIRGIQRVDASQLNLKYIWDEHPGLLSDVSIFFVALLSLILDRRNEKAAKVNTVEK